MSLARISGIAVQIGCAALISGALFPPGEIGKQLLVALTWYLAGIFTAVLWHS